MASSRIHLRFIFRSTTHRSRLWSSACCRLRTGLAYNDDVTVTLDLSDEALSRLEAEAARRGVTVDVLVAELAAQLPRETDGGHRLLSFVGLGSSSSGRGARDADEMLADGFARD